LDGFLRSEDEIAGLREVLGWKEGTVEEEADSSKKTEKGQKGATKKSGTTRVDMDALAKVLHTDLGEDKDDVHHFDLDMTSTSGLEEIENWRPLSPGDKGAYAYSYDGMDRYDEEY